VVEKQMRRGCGLVTFHYSTFAPNKIGERILEWTGGYFDYQSGPAASGWYSKMQHWDAAAKPIATVGRSFECKPGIVHDGKVQLDFTVSDTTVVERTDNRVQLHSTSTRTITTVQLGKLVKFRLGKGEPDHQSWIELTIDEVKP
jgi:hypothetical protein